MIDCIFVRFAFHQPGCYSGLPFGCIYDSWLANTDRDRFVFFFCLFLPSNTIQFTIPKSIQSLLKNAFNTFYSRVNIFHLHDMCVCLQTSMARRIDNVENCFDLLKKTIARFRHTNNKNNKTAASIKRFYCFPQLSRNHLVWKKNICMKKNNNSQCKPSTTQAVVGQIIWT